MWPQWIPELLPRIKEEMSRLLAKHPKGIEGFKATRNQGLASRK
jgi:hypothetical protein